jgi:hypothetical protein
MTPGKNHRARGLCGACYDRALLAGTLDDYPPARLTRDELLTEYELLRLAGVPPWQMPGRVGMTAAAFERGMLRARAARDPRARQWRGMQENGNDGGWTTKRARAA